jgi:hypothetical protein
LSQLPFRVCHEAATRDIDSGRKAVQQRMVSKPLSVVLIWLSPRNRGRRRVRRSRLRIDRQGMIAPVRGLPGELSCRVAAESEPAYFDPDQVSFCTPWHRSWKKSF